MSEPIFRIVYCSRKLIGGDQAQAELDDILATARRNNAAQNVTGALLYSHGMFAQTLEGAFEAVQTIFERILVDPRHQDVVVIQADTVPARTFGAWAMAYAEPKDPARAREVLARVLAQGAADQFDQVLDLLNTVVATSRRPLLTPT